jgi:antitoxin (DNA-binding transcriptional repressor) of toxin-antitoxin stability system
VKTVGIREAKALLSAYVARSQRERVLILRRGRPAALLTGVEGKDLEDIILANDPMFWKMIRERRRERASISLDEVSRRLKLPPSRPSKRRRGGKPR